MFNSSSESKTVIEAAVSYPISPIRNAVTKQQALPQKQSKSCYMYVLVLNLLYLYLGWMNVCIHTIKKVSYKYLLKVRWTIYQELMDLSERV